MKKSSSFAISVLFALLLISNIVSALTFDLPQRDLTILQSRNIRSLNFQFIECIPGQCSYQISYRITNRNNLNLTLRNSFIVPLYIANNDTLAPIRLSDQSIDSMISNQVTSYFSIMASRFSSSNQILVLPNINTNITLRGHR